MTLSANTGNGLEYKLVKIIALLCRLQRHITATVLPFDGKPLLHRTTVITEFRGFDPSDRAALWLALLVE